MKKSILLLTSSVFIALGGIVYLTNNPVNEQFKRNYKLTDLKVSKDKSQNWNDAAELYQELYADIYTGKIEKEQLRLAKQEVLQMTLDNDQTIFETQCRDHLYQYR